MPKDRVTRAARLRSGREPILSGLPLEKGDLEAARRHWEGLSVEARVAALHFEDEPLVQRLHSARQALLDADLLCFACGMRGQDDTRRQAGVDEFAIECCQTEAGDLRPAALFAKQSFAERGDVFELLERRFDSPFLEGRPALQRRDWASLLGQGANTWSDLMWQILRLVELSIFHVYHDAQKAAAELEVAEVAAALVSCPTVAVPETQSQKRRQRKKKADAHAASDLAVVSAAESKPALEAEGEDVPTNKLELIKTRNHVGPVFEDEPPRKAPAGDDLIKKQPDADLPVEIPCMSSLAPVTPEAAAEMFAWTHNTEVFDFAEGWVLPGGLRAVVRNTFLDVVPEQGQSRVRARSL